MCNAVMSNSLMLHKRTASPYGVSNEYLKYCGSNVLDKQLPTWTFAHIFTNLGNYRIENLFASDNTVKVRQQIPSTIPGISITYRKSMSGL
jgi:hypothetical protein